VKPFEQVVAEHGPTVLRVCRALLGPVDADDAWSETFLSALRAYPGLDPGANVEAWLVTIAHRKAVDIHRAAVRRAVPVAEVPESTTRHDSTDAWGHADLWSALRELPPKQRQTVAYHYLAGFPHREVAEIVGGSEAAARRAAADGIATLRRTYLQHGSQRSERAHRR
jgi:RNA polymerase sigma factor (sigma-70 family)